MDKKEKMYNLIEEQLSSGIIQKEFCKEKGIVLAQFKYWKTKWLAEQDGKQTASFIHIPTPSPIFEENAEIEVFYPNGVSLKLKTKDISLIQELVRHV
jgi:hypothetical protein